MILAAVTGLFAVTVFAIVRDPKIKVGLSAAMLIAASNAVTVFVGNAANMFLVPSSSASATTVLWLLWCAASLRNFEKVVFVMVSTDRPVLIARSVVLHRSWLAARPWLRRNTRERFLGVSKDPAARALRILLLLSILAFAAWTLGITVALYSLVIIFISHSVQVLICTVIVIESWFRARHIPTVTVPRIDDQFFQAQDKTL